MHTGDPVPRKRPVDAFEEVIDVHATPWALVLFSETHATVAARWTYHASEAEARAAAEAKHLKRTEIAIVDVTKKAPRGASIDAIIRATSRPILENPYPPEKPNLDPLRMTPGGYDGWNRAAARPVQGFKGRWV